MMAVDFGYHYENGISYPYTTTTENSNQLYGDALQHLCRETSYNKLRLKQTLFKSDRDKAQNIVRWEFGKPSEAKVKQPWFYEGDAPSWADERPIFSEDAGQHFACNSCNKQPKEAESQCYLCSTLEEHQKHAAKRGVFPERKKKPKPRIKFIPPPPIVKLKEKEVEEKAEVLYRFAVKTGGHPNAGTNAQVTVKLKGDHGIMRKKTLKKKTSAKFVFGRNTTEVFFVKGPEIGNLSMLAIEHDGIEQSHAWYLEEVEVTKMNTEQMWLFVCKDWLSLYHGHGELKKILRADHLEVHPRGFEISVTTGDKIFAGTDANVFITLYGSKGVSRKLQLKNRSKNPFEKGSTENFFVTVKENIGPIRRVRVEHDNSGSGPGWLLEQVSVNDLESGQKLKFPCGQWLATDEGDGQIARDLHPLQKGDQLLRASPGQREVSSILDDLDHYRLVVNGSQRSVSSLDSSNGRDKGKVARGPLLRYEVTVLTGKARYAGTDAHVYLTLIGKRGRSSEVELFDTAKDLFEMGQTDVFKIQTEDVGEIKRILVRHDNSGLGAGWFLEKINIKRYFSKEDIREKLMKLQGEIDESLAKKMAELHGEEIESPHHSKPKVTGSVKIKKQKDSGESDSDGDMDAANIFSSYQQKKNKNKGNKAKKHGLTGDGEESDDSLKKRYKREKKKMEKKDDADEEVRRERMQRVAKIKKMKWISYGGYRMQVTDDEFDKKENVKKSRKSKKKVKYPTDSSSDSEDMMGENRRHKIKGKKGYSKYASDSEEDSEDEKYKKDKKYKQEESDKHNRRKGHKKKQGHRRDYSNSSGEDEKAFSSLYKKDRIPYYDDYLFECHRWLAKDEDDGRIDREFKAKSVTTFYKMKD